MRKYLWSLILALLFLSFFIYQKVSPFGFQCQAKLISTNHFIFGRGCLSLASPQDRRELKDNLIVKGDPLYFSLYAPRKFENLDVEIIFQPKFEDNLSNISLGLLVNKELWQYYLQSIYNQDLDRFNDYYAIYEEPLLLLQKDKQFDSIDEWLLTFNDQGKSLCQDKELHQCLSVYNLQAAEKNRIRPYYNLAHLEKQEVNLKLKLKGRHTFFIYLNEEDNLDLLLKFAGPKDETVLVEILKDDYSVYQYQESSLADLNLSLSNLGGGVFQVNILISDDVFIDQLKIQARAMVFKNRFWSNVNEKLSIVTDENNLHLKLLSPENRQVISFAGETYNIEELFIQHKLESNNPSNNLIEMEKASLLLESNGYFALNENLLFNPGFGNLQASTQPDFILANYIVPEKLDDKFLKAKATFKLSQTFYENNLYNFIISIPGLRAEDSTNSELLVKSIKFRFYDQTSFLSKIRNLTFNSGS